MSEYHIQTRRRSRSRTPLIDLTKDETINVEDKTARNHRKKISIAPSSQAIVEESVEVTSSSPSSSYARRSQPVSRASDYSSEGNSFEGKAGGGGGGGVSHLTVDSGLELLTSISTTTTTVTAVAKSSKRTESYQSAVTSTPIMHSGNENFSHMFVANDRKRGGLASHRTFEIAQNELNSEYERHSQQGQQKQKQQQQQQQRDYNNGHRNNSNFQNVSANRIFGTSLIDQSQNDHQYNLDDHPAYKEYKCIGEYWNMTPKTDYTYSVLSKQRRLLAPGVVAMPNMSRKSLDNHRQRIDDLIEMNPAQESYIRQRYQLSMKRKTTQSSDEVDTQRSSYKFAKESLFTRFITTILGWFTSCWSFFTRLSAEDRIQYNYNYGYNPVVEHTKRGFFAKIGYGIYSAIATIIRYIYLGSAYVMLVDARLLQSSTFPSRNKKRFLMFLLIILPLLLLAGFYYYLHPDDPFPPVDIPALKAVALSKLHMSEIISEADFDAIKTSAYGRLDDVLRWTDDYVLFLKTISHNVIEELYKFFRWPAFLERT